jgi:signal peptidase I
VEAQTQPSPLESATVASFSFEQRNARARKLWFQASRLFGTLLLGFLSWYLISHFFVQSVTVIGESMKPTLHDSSRYLLNRWVFLVRTPKVQDIVVLRDPLDNGYSVKRIVAGSGDSVLLEKGAVFVNGRKLAESYLPAGTATYAAPQNNARSFTCGSGQYFVLGDNRGNSIDSRVYGPVPRKNILGLIIY